MVRTPIDPGLKCRYLTVVESNLRQFHGLMLDGQNQLHLLTTDNYRLIKLDLPGYDAETMDFKIIFDPLYKTAVYSDDRLIRAVAMDQDYRPIASHEHVMSRAAPGVGQRIGDYLFPFRLVMNSENSRMIEPEFKLSPSALGGFMLMGILAALIYGGLYYYRHQRRPEALNLAFVFAAGLYGLIAGILILDE